MEQFITRIRTNLNGVLEMTQMFGGLMMTGDNLANRIIVELNRDGTPVSVPEGYSIIGYAIRNDGYTLDIPGSIIEEDGYRHAYIDIPDLAYLVSGSLSIAIRMISGEHKVVIATASCYINTTQTDAIIDTSHRIPSLEDLLEKLAEFDRDMALMTEAEYIRGQNEEQRQAAEGIRQQTFETNESTRGQTFTTNEAARQQAFETAEAQRQSNETTRQENESTRQTNEGTRQGNESARQTNEGTRQSNESTRQSQETARQDAQDARNREIDNMTVEAQELNPYETPTATITEVDGHKHIIFGLTPGDPFVIAKVFASIAEMEAYTGTDVRVGQFVIISSNEEDPDNAKMYVKTSSGWSFVTDLSGAQGIQGPRGFTGNGISSAVLNADYTLTIYFTDGDSYTTPNSIRGIQGQTGNGISLIEMNPDYTLTITMTNGDSFTTPVPIKGATGDTGKGIQSAVVNADYTLTITWTDGTTFTTPSLKGEPGAAGTNFVYDADEKSLVVEFY